MNQERVVASHAHVVSEQRFVPTSSDLTTLSCEPREGFIQEIKHCQDCGREGQTDGEFAQDECEVALITRLRKAEQHSEAQTETIHWAEVAIAKRKNEPPPVWPLKGVL